MSLFYKFSDDMDFLAKGYPAESSVMSIEKISLALKNIASEIRTTQSHSGALNIPSKRQPFEQAWSSRRICSIDIDWPIRTYSSIFLSKWNFALSTPFFSFVANIARLSEAYVFQRLFDLNNFAPATAEDRRRRLRETLREAHERLLELGYLPEIRDQCAIDFSWPEELEDFKPADPFDFFHTIRQFASYIVRSLRKLRKLINKIVDVIGSCPASSPRKTSLSGLLTTLQPSAP